MTHSRFYQELGWRCAVLRQRAGLDEREAAIKAGLDPRTWRNIERGRRCRTETFWKIGRAFGCSFDWLAGEGARI